MTDGAKVMIEAKGLSKYYGPFVAVQDISFTIPEGQIVAFLGPNGAGQDDDDEAADRLSGAEQRPRVDRRS